MVISLASLTMSSHRLLVVRVDGSANVLVEEYADLRRVFAAKMKALHTTGSSIVKVESAVCTVQVADELWTELQKLLVGQELEKQLISFMAL